MHNTLLITYAAKTPCSEVHEQTGNRLRPLMSLLVLFMVLFSKPAFSQTAQAPAGQRQFERRCTMCHGKTGDRQRFGAKNLRTSRLSDDELRTVILKGRNRMPSWRSELSDAQLRDIITFIKTFRS